MIILLNLNLNYKFILKLQWLQKASTQERKLNWPLILSSLILPMVHLNLRQVKTFKLQNLENLLMAVMNL